MTVETDHVTRNRDWWNANAAKYQSEHASQLPTSAPVWGIWSIPERELNVLGDVAGRDVLELGCGGAQWSIGLARQGARCTGLDLSAAQLDFARELLATEAEPLDVTLVESNAEVLPFDDESFDIAFCDYGASIFADPRRWVPEAARVLRPGGLLAFSCGTPLLECCWPLDQDDPVHELVRDYFGMYEFADKYVSLFSLTYGEWIRVLSGAGLQVFDLVETQPPAGTTHTTYRSEAHVAWSRRWPAEQIWKARKPG